MAHRSLRAAAAGTDRRLGRPGAFQPDAVEGQQVGRQRRRRTPTTSTYGVREFAMTAISNGLALHGGFIPYDATFLVFSDYARNARAHERADAGAHAIHVYTHDSIGLGEDGPTHQPIEHLASLRYIPNNDVWRPCDAVESAVCVARGDRAPRRPELPGVHAPEPAAPAAHDAAGRRHRARRLRAARQPTARRTLILIATGSEVGLAMQAARAARRDGIRCAWCRCRRTDVFDRQDAAYREAVLPNAVPQARRDRSRRHRLLAQVRRPGRRGDRHRQLRRVRAGRGAVPALRLHGGERGAGGEKARVNRGAIGDCHKARIRGPCRFWCRPNRQWDNARRRADGMRPWSKVPAPHFVAPWVYSGPMAARCSLAGND